MPYTISFVIRKRKQIDSINELPEANRPPEYMLWMRSGDEINKWIKKSLDPKYKDNSGLVISELDIEG